MTAIQNSNRRILFVNVLVATVALLTVLAFSPLAAQEQMSKDEWQRQMTDYTNQQLALNAQVKALDSTIAVLRSQSDKLTADVTACEDALYAMLGVTRADVEAFDKELTDMENRVAELQRMSDAELLTHKSEIETMQNRLNEMAKSKIAMIPRYHDRIGALQEKVAGLLSSMQKEKTYTVGTWSRNRDCLWNIAKKRDIYANAWMWPKIWQGNRDMIKDPDLIKPRWVLKIPEGKELSREERSAANRYYRQKAASAP